MIKVLIGAAAGVVASWLLLLIVANAGDPLVISFSLHVPRPEGGTAGVTDWVDRSAVVRKIALVLDTCFDALIGALAGHAADRPAASEPPAGFPSGHGRSRGLGKWNGPLPSRVALLPRPGSFVCLHITPHARLYSSRREKWSQAREACNRRRNVLWDGTILIEGGISRK